MMDVCLRGRSHSFVRSFDVKEFKIQLSYAPLVGRRPNTSYSARKAFSPSPRIQSAQPRITMTATPRTHVSTAGFYDWSSEESGGDVSVANIYRKIAINQKNKYNKGNKNWCADGIHLNPGRMFVRDKADLTKGERDIIAGIYKNRGDVNKEVGNGIATHIKSHKDAWLIGKQIPKKMGSPVESDKCSVRVPDHFFSRLESPTQAPCYLCDNCKEDCIHLQSCQELRNTKHEKFGRTAPPSSPRNSPKTQKKTRTKPSKTNMSEGAVFIESGKTFYDPDEGSKKKKVFVDVFLPKFPTQILNDEKTSISIDLEMDKCKKKNKHENSQTKKSSNDQIEEKLFQLEPLNESIG